MNKVILTGNLVRDIELRKTAGGNSVVSNCIAVSRDRKEADGTYGTDFINFVVWGQSAEYLSKYAYVGNKLEIVGRWQVRQYTDRNGQTQTANEVVVESITCFSKKPTEDEQESNADLDDIDITEDDLPF